MLMRLFPQTQPQLGLLLLLLRLPPPRALSQQTVVVSRP
jgi:hypothetical protein